MLEDRKDSVDDRLKMTEAKLEDANVSLQGSDGGREAMANKFELTSDKIEELERLVSEAKLAAQEADRRCEDVVR